MRHGGDLGPAIERFGGRPDDWLDLSSAVNPRPYTLTELRLDALSRLPNPADIARVENAASSFYGVPEGFDIVAASGSEALIRAFAATFPGRCYVMPTTYRSYVDAFEERLTEDPARADILALVRPNNPDGVRYPLPALRDNALVLVDEAYGDPREEKCLLSVERGRRIVALRSFGKFFGLPGLRLGFALARTDDAARLRRAIGDWPISTLAVEIGREALRDTAWHAQTRLWLAAQAQRVSRLLRKHRLHDRGTDLFRYVEHPRAGDLHEVLAQARVWTRRFDERPHALRIGLPADENGCRRLDAALAAFAA